MAKILGSITVFPAQAGVIPRKTTAQFRCEGLSRASGGDPEFTKLDIEKIKAEAEGTRKKLFAQI